MKYIFCLIYDNFRVMQFFTDLKMIGTEILLKKRRPKANIHFLIVCFIRVNKAKKNRKHTLIYEDFNFNHFPKNITDLYYNLSHINFLMVQNSLQLSNLFRIFTNLDLYFA